MFKINTVVHHICLLMIDTVIQIDCIFKNFYILSLNYITKFDIIKQVLHIFSIVAFTLKAGLNFLINFTQLFPENLPKLFNYFQINNVIIR